jgi:hypothetical protein
MAYNPYYQFQPYQQTPQQVSQPLIWVQGESGAKSFMVAPGQTVALWDSEAQVIYLKSADASGMPSMRILDYKIRDPLAQVSPGYATQGDLEKLLSRVAALEAKMGGVTYEPSVSDASAATAK